MQESKINLHVEAYIQLFKNNNISSDGRRNMIEGDELEKEAEHIMNQITL